MGQQLYELLRECTMRVSVLGKIGYGTGFFVAPGLILTCAHIFEAVQPNTPSADVYWNGQHYPARMADLRKNYDLALLRVDLTEHPCVCLEEEAKIRDPLTSYGYSDNYPGGDTITCECEGWTEDTQRLLKFKMAQVRPGMSGAPLLNEDTGYVCGIVKRSSDRDSALGGRAITTTAVFQAFAELADQQKQFHKWNRRWSDCLDVQRYQQHSQKASDTLWNVPHQPNPFFIGREDILKYLHNTLTSSGGALRRPQAISGLSGIGKTQIAIEYIYRYHTHYQAFLWPTPDP